jgi:hypothetical protein
LSAAATAVLVPSSPGSTAMPGTSLQGPTGSSDRQAEFKARLERAKNDAPALWKLYDWCEAAGLSKEQRTVLLALVKANPNDRKARELLGHVYQDGQWFETTKKAEEARAKALAAEARRQGKVVRNGELVDPADVPMLDRGLVRDEAGRWVPAEDLKRLREGWVRQDAQWIAPEEAPKVEQGLWKCGEQWLSLAEANTYHSKIETCWVIPSEHSVVFSTHTRDIALAALEQLEASHAALVRIFGQAPERKLAVLALANAEQYNDFASSRERARVELRGLSSVHGAFLAELYRAPEAAGFSGGGVCLFDASTDEGLRFGKTFARCAYGLSFGEALDPSPQFLAEVSERGAPSERGVEEFWSEKTLPEWFRFGAAAYVERYMPDTKAPDPQWPKKWSVENLRAGGGLDPLATILAFEPSAQDKLATAKMLNQFGLLVSYVLEGQNPAVTEAHGALTRTLAERKHPGKAVKELEKHLLQNESGLRTFAGLER